MSTLSSYVKEAIAFIKGDTAEAIAAKNERKGLAAFRAQIASLKYKLTQDDDVIESATEALNKAYYPSEAIEDGTAYIRNIKEKSDTLEKAKENKKDTEATIEKYNEIIKTIFGA